MRKIKFKACHAQSILSNATEDIRQKLDIDKLKLLENAGPCHTWLDSDGIIGCGGVVIMPNDIGEAWCIVDNNITFKRKRLLLRGARKFLKDVLDFCSLEYLQATWSDSFDEKINWLKHLGFKKTNIQGIQSSTIYIRRF